MKKTLIAIAIAAVLPFTVAAPSQAASERDSLESAASHAAARRDGVGISAKDQNIRPGQYARLTVTSAFHYFTRVKIQAQRIGTDGWKTVKRKNLGGGSYVASLRVRQYGEKVMIYRAKVYSTQWRGVSDEVGVASSHRH